MDKILADRIKNKFRAKVEVMKVNFKRVRVEQSHVTTDLVEQGGRFEKLEAHNKTSDMSLCLFHRGPCEKDAARSIKVDFG